MQSYYPSVILALAIGSWSGLPQNEDLLELALAGHRQSRESIHAIRATIGIRAVNKLDPHMDPNNVITYVCRWAQEGERARWDVTRVMTHSRPLVSKGKSDPKAVVRVEDSHRSTSVDGKITSIQSTSQSDGLKRTIALINPSTKGLGFENLWSRAGFVCIDSPKLTVLDLLSKKPSELKVSWSTVEGQKTIRIDYHEKLGQQELEVHLLPECGYLARRISHKTARPNGEKPRILQLDMKDFKLINPGVYFPTCSEQTYFHSDAAVGDYLSKSTTRFEDVVINQPASPEVFQLEIPAGVNVTDRIQNTSYIMGLGQRPDPKFRVQTIPNRTDVTASVTAVTAEPRNRVLIAAIIAAGVSTIGAAIYWRSRRKRMPAAG